MFFLHTLFRFILDALFPKTCVGCGVLNTWLCGTCCRSLTWDGTMRCPVCLTASERHAACTSELDGILITGQYRDRTLASAIHLLKYQYVGEIADVLGMRIAETLHPLASGMTTPLCLVPIPLHARRERERGFNHAELIARAATRTLSVKLEAAVLTRHRSTKQQATLGRDARRRNVEGAFEIRGPVDSGSTYVLIDDVLTTGATLEAAARTLRAAGATRVWACVIASDAALYRMRCIR